MIQLPSPKCLLIFLLLITSLITPIDGRKVMVTRTVKKTIRRIPANGAPTEKHFVRQEHYTSGSDDKNLVAQHQIEAAPGIHASHASYSNGAANPGPDDSGGQQYASVKTTNIVDPYSSVYPPSYPYPGYNVGKNGYSASGGANNGRGSGSYVTLQNMKVVGDEEGTGSNAGYKINGGAAGSGSNSVLSTIGLGTGQATGGGVSSKTVVLKDEGGGGREEGIVEEIKEEVPIGGGNVYRDSGVPVLRSGITIEGGKDGGSGIGGVVEEELTDEELARKNLDIGRTRDQDRGGLSNVRKNSSGSRLRQVSTGRGRSKALANSNLNGDMVEEELTDEELTRRQLDGNGCEDEWQEYNGNCYKLITKKVTWEEAERECQNEQADLTSIHDKMENEFVAALSAKFETNFDNFCDGFWIGLTRKLVPGMDVHKSEWIDGTRVTFGNVPKHTEFFMPPWRGGQPDDPANGIEECVHMYPKLGCDSHPQIYYGQWNDFGCSKQLAGAACKKRRSSRRAGSINVEDDGFGIRRDMITDDSDRSGLPAFSIARDESIGSSRGNQRRRIGSGSSGRRRSKVDVNGGDMLEEELTDEELARRELDGSSGICGEDWQEYNGYCYKLVTRKLNWEEAEEECLNEKAHLASIRDKMENEFIAALTAKFETNFDNFCDGFWIGMTRKLVPGMDVHKSKWNDGTRVTFGNVPKHTEFFMPPWRGGQPDDPTNGIEECVHMYPKLGCDSKPQIYYGQWNDFGCSKQLAGAVCKRRA